MTPEKREYPSVFEPQLKDTWVHQQGPFPHEREAIIAAVALDERLKALEARLDAAEKKEAELPLWSEALESLPCGYLHLLENILEQASKPVDIEAELQTLDRSLKHVTEPATALGIRAICGQLLHRIQSRNNLIVAIYTAMMPKGGESDTKANAVSAKGR